VFLVAAAVAGDPAPAPSEARALPALGRLLLTPEQRRELDLRRARQATESDATSPDDLLPDGATARRRVIVNGLLHRGRGDTVVWVNGRALDATDGAAAAVQVGAGPNGGDRVAIRPGKHAAPVRLKPGQTWNPDTGEVTDCVQCVAPRPAVGAAPSEESPEGESSAPIPAEPLAAAAGPAGASALAPTRLASGPTPAPGLESP
jgi:hypothetical protein